MSVKVGVTRGIISLGSARIATNLLNAASLLVLARLLTPRDFGVVAITTALLSVVISSTDMSFQSALIHCRNVTRAHIDTVWSMSFIRAVVIIGFFLFAAIPLAEVYSSPTISSSQLVPVLVTAGIGGAFLDFYNPRLAVATSEMRFGPEVTFQIAQKLVSLSLAVGLALYFKSFWAIIVGNALGAVTASLLSYFLIPYTPRFSLARFREIWGFSGWLFLGQLCETMNWRFDNLLIGHAVRKAELGIYSVADNVAVIPLREMAAPIRNSLFPGMASLNVLVARLRHTYLRAQSALAMVAAPASIGLALVAGPAVQVMLGENWLNCVVFVQIFAVNYAIETFSVLTMPLVMAMGRTKLLFLTRLPALIVRIPLITLGLLYGGLVGAALGKLIGEVVLLLINLLIPQLLLDLSAWKQLRSHAMTFVGLAAMSMVLLLAKNPVHDAFRLLPMTELLVMSSLGATVYFGTVFILWIATGKAEGPVSEILGFVRTFLEIGRRSQGAVGARTRQESLESP